MAEPDHLNEVQKRFDRVCIRLLSQ